MLFVTLFPQTLFNIITNTTIIKVVFFIVVFVINKISEVFVDFGFIPLFCRKEYLAKSFYLFEKALKLRKFFKAFNADYFLRAF